jgi:hypothetical protein
MVLLKLLLKLICLICFVFFSPHIVTANTNTTTKSKAKSTLPQHLQVQAQKHKDQMLQALKDRQVFYMNIQGSSSQSLFSEPFQTDVNSCTTARCRVTSRVDNQFKLSPTGRVENKVKIENGQKSLEAWVEVRTATEDGEIKTGWIALESLSTEKPSLMDNFWHDREKTPTHKLGADSQWMQFTKACGAAWRQRTGQSLFVPGIEDMHGLREKVLDAAKKPLSAQKVAEKLTGLAGVCTLNDPKNPQLSDFSGPEDRPSAQHLSYDSSVLPKLMESSSALPATGKSESIISAVNSLDIPGMNFQKFVEIDALARTLYAEMASCHDDGPEYLMAVARVIKNREEAYLKSPEVFKHLIFEEEKTIHWPGKSVATKIASSPIQFSAWNRHIIDFEALKKARQERIEAEMRNGLSQVEAEKIARAELQADRNANPPRFYKVNISGMAHTLCPPAHPNQIFHTGGKPSPEMQEIWRSALEVATESVMAPDQFKRKTQSLTGVLHYTSDRDQFASMKPVEVQVQGKALNNSKCINFWKPAGKK